MHLRDEQAFIVTSCPSCDVKGEMPLSAIRQEFLCTKCGTLQRLPEENAKAIENAIADAISEGVKRLVDGEDRALVWKHPG